MAIKIEQLVEQINKVKNSVELHQANRPNNKDVVGIKRWQESLELLKRKLKWYIGTLLKMGCEYNIVEVEGLYIKNSLEVGFNIYFTNISIEDVKTLVNYRLRNFESKVTILKYREIIPGTVNNKYT